MIPEPPRMPNLKNLPNDLQEYIKLIDSWANKVYTTLKLFDLEIKISSGASAPTGGQDGDLYIQKDGLNTKLYLNINGTFSGYNNP